MDERLRALERAWRERGDLEAGVALLRERERAGALSRARLELAAALEHAPARAALGLPAAPPPAGDRLPVAAFTRGATLPLGSGPEGVRLTVETLDDRLTLLLRVGGPLNADASWFPRALDELVAWGVRRLAVQLSDVRFVGSMSMAALTRVADRLTRRGGGLTLVGVTPRVAVVMELLGLTGLLGLHEDLDRAVAALADRPPAEAEPRAWLLGLSRWGREPCVRAALLALEQQAGAALPALPGEAAAAAAARAWLACPCAEHRRLAREAAVRAGAGWAAAAAIVAGTGAWPLGVAEGAPLADEAAVRAAVVAWAIG